MHQGDSGQQDLASARQVSSPHLKGRRARTPQEITGTSTGQCRQAGRFESCQSRQGMGTLGDLKADPTEMNNLAEVRPINR